MSILGNIMSGIFGSSAKAEVAPSTPIAPKMTPDRSEPGEVATATRPQVTEAAKPAPGGGSVDVAAILDDLAKKSEDKDLDWRKSIVDLMKIMKLDSTLKARKQLAKELNYTGNTKNSASMNIWLHQQVMARLVANGGKLPADLMS